MPRCPIRIFVLIASGVLGRNGLCSLLTYLLNGYVPSLCLYWSMYVCMTTYPRRSTTKMRGRCRHNIAHDISTVHTNISLYKCTVQSVHPPFAFSRIRPNVCSGVIIKIKYLAGLLSVFSVVTRKGSCGSKMFEK